jgi:hypothetical protein
MSLWIFELSFIKVLFLLGMVALTCNPSYLEGGDQKDGGSRGQSGQTVSETLSQTIKKKLSVVAHTCHPSYLEV